MIKTHCSHWHSEPHPQRQRRRDDQTSSEESKLERIRGEVRSIHQGRLLVEADLLGERRSSIGVSDYIDHYHEERSHQGIGNELIEKPPDLGDGEVLRRERLGGVLKYRYRRTT